MRLSYLKEANSLEVNKWLEESLQLTDYQKEKLREDEVVRFSQFYFYKQAKGKSSPIWRLTLPFYVVYWIAAVVMLPFNFIITGKWGYGRSFIDKFHSPWMRKLGL